MAPAVTGGPQAGPEPSIPHFHFDRFKFGPGIRHTGGSYVSILQQSSNKPGTCCVVDIGAKGLAIAIRNTLSDPRTQKEFPELYVESWKKLDIKAIGKSDTTGFEDLIGTELEDINAGIEAPLERFKEGDLDRLSRGGEYVVHSRYQISYYKDGNNFRIRDLQSKTDNIEMPFKDWVLLCALVAGDAIMEKFDSRMYCKGLQLRALLIENPNCLKPLPPPPAADESVALPTAEEQPGLPSADDARAKALDEREAALQEREAALEAREQALNLKEAELIEREAALAAGHATLDDRRNKLDADLETARQRLIAVGQSMTEVASILSYDATS